MGVNRFLEGNDESLADILQITKLPAAGKTTNFTNHYSLSDSIIAETVALRRRG